METVGAINFGPYEQEGKNENDISIHISPLFVIRFLIALKMVVGVGVAGSWDAAGVTAAAGFSTRGIKFLQNRTTKSITSLNVFRSI